MKIGFLTVVFSFFSPWIEWRLNHLNHAVVNSCNQPVSQLFFSPFTPQWHLNRTRRHLSDLLLVACTRLGLKWSKAWYETSLVFGVCFMHIGLNIPQNTIKYTIFSYKCFFRYHCLTGTVTFVQCTASSAANVDNFDSWDSLRVRECFWWGHDSHWNMQHHNSYWVTIWEPLRLTIALKVSLNTSYLLGFTEKMQSWLIIELRVFFNNRI